MLGLCQAGLHAGSRPGARHAAARHGLAQPHCPGEVAGERGNHVVLAWALWDGQDGSNFCTLHSPLGLEVGNNEMASSTVQDCGNMLWAFTVLDILTPDVMQASLTP